MDPASAYMVRGLWHERNLMYQRAWPGMPRVSLTGPCWYCAAVAASSTGT